MQYLVCPCFAYLFVNSVNRQPVIRSARVTLAPIRPRVAGANPRN